MRTIFKETLRRRKTTVIVAVALTLTATITAWLVLAAISSFAAADADDPAAESTDESEQEPVWEDFSRTELYFGSEKPDGSEVTEEEFEQFVDDEATPSFPNGLTTLTGEGQYRGSDGAIVEEQSFVLILLYPPDDTEANAEIEEIREDYKSEFEQESVLRVDSSERVSF